jgi:hypothetical protein
MRCCLIDLLRKHRKQLENEVNKTQQELRSVGLLKREICPEQIEKLKNDLDNYQNTINSLSCPHKEDPSVVNISIPQTLVTTCGLSLQDLESQKPKDINILKEEVNILPKKEQENLEKWNYFTIEDSKKYSPEYALPYALQNAIPKPTIAQIFDSEDNIAVLLKQGTIIERLRRLPECDLAKVVNLLQDIGTISLKFNEQTSTDVQILILIGVDVIPALNYTKQSKEITMMTTQIFSKQPVLGIITALEKEYAAVKAIFGEGQEKSHEGRGAGRRYWLTDIAGSKGIPLTIAVTLADMGNNIAAVRATNILLHYPSIKHIIMCGIAGGVPHPTKVEDHVRLGDIVISNRKGIVQYDFKKESQKFTEIRANPVPPSAELLEAVRYLRTDEMSGKRPWEDVILKALKDLGWEHPSVETDKLYDKDTLISHPEDSERRENQPKIFVSVQGGS